MQGDLQRLVRQHKVTTVLGFIRDLRNKYQALLASLKAGASQEPINETDKQYMRIFVAAAEAVRHELNESFGDDDDDCDSENRLVDPIAKLYEMAGLEGDYHDDDADVVIADALRDLDPQELLGQKTFGVITDPLMSFDIEEKKADDAQAALERKLSA